MAIVNGDILQIAHFQRQANQPLMNIYFYEVVEVDSVPTYLEVLGAQFGRTWTLNRRALTNAALTFERSEVRNLSNGLDVFDVVINEAGTGSGDAMPPNVSVTIKQQRATLVTRNGYKRYAGIPEAAQNNGQLATAAFTNWADFAAQLATPINVDGAGGDCVLNPIILGVDPETGERDLLKVNPIQSATPNRVLGTQNSRKIQSGSV